MYENGDDYISPHSDKEKELSNVGVVALSFGAGRNFRIRAKHPLLATINNQQQTYNGNQIILNHITGNGELIWMKGEFQKEFLTWPCGLEQA